MALDRRAQDRHWGSIPWAVVRLLSNRIRSPRTKVGVPRAYRGSPDAHPQRVSAAHRHDVTRSRAQYAGARGFIGFIGKARFAGLNPSMSQRGRAEPAERIAELVRL